MSDLTKSFLDRCLHAVWQRTQQKHFASGLLAFARWFVPLFFAAIIIDRFAYTPGWLRAVGALALLAVASIKAWRHGWSSIRGFNAAQTAQTVELSQGGMDSLLATGLQFRQSGATPGTSAAMWEHALRKAESAAEKIAPSSVVSLRDLKKPLRIALVLAALIAILAILNGPFLAAGLGRMFTPWLAISYPTKTKIELDTEVLVIKEGAAGAIEIRFSGSVPKTAKLALQTGEGSPREIELGVEKDLSTYEIASASRDFKYRVKAGDARSEWQQVRVIPAPRLAKVKVNLDFPDYIDRPNETAEALTLTVPEGTKVHWELTLDTKIRNATLHRDGAEDLPLKIGDDGRTLTLSEAATASRGYSFSWTEDQHGFDFTSPRYFLQVASDQAPHVELTAPETNLNAMLGRSLDLAVRAQDDHGIGTTTITYRVNRRPEKTITLPTPVRNGEGEQKIDWDYRKELPDLQVGDSVSFVLEVSDKYAGEGGAHRARTESRRITFLSREEYLAAITKQMERLLTRVRALYRQERAAHEFVLGLDPSAESYLPTCQLETIRQEMIREQLIATTAEVRILLDDLAANKITDAVESNLLTGLRDNLSTIADGPVARAAGLFRAQVGAKTYDPQPAIATVNEAARELGNLVLQRGIDAAREVYARESHMIAVELALLRVRLLTATPEQAETLAKGHEEVAGWTELLLDKLSRNMRYDLKALAVLGLSRRIHDQRASEVTKAIRQVATLARAGKNNEAANALYPLIRPILGAEFTMRPGSEYAMIRSLREKLGSLISEQEALLAACKDETDSAKLAAELASRQATLRDALVLAPLPSIPAPRTRLADLTMPPLPPADDLRLRTETGMTQAIVHLKAGAKDDALNQQREAIDSLKKLDTIIVSWSEELAQKTLGTSSLVSDATNRAGVLTKLETSQLDLLERTEKADRSKKDGGEFIDEQQSIAQELADFHKELAGGESGPAKELLPLLGRVKEAVQESKLAADTLRAKQIKDALAHQELASDALGEAREMAAIQLSQLNQQQLLIEFEQSVSKAAAGMDDIVGGQNDLITATKAADEKSMPPLLMPQQNLLKCLTDIAPSLDLVAARLDVGTPLVFAGSDVEDALKAMEDGDGEGAAEIQDIAVGSLAKVQSLVTDVAAQTGYVTEIVEFLQAAQSNASMLAFRQRELRENTEAKDALSIQKTLTADTTKSGLILKEVAGQVDFEKLDEKTKEKFADFGLTLNFETPATHMAEAVRLLESGQPATDAMLTAEKSLNAVSGQLGVIISMLSGLPSIEVTKASPPELHRLIAVLDLASKHRRLLRQTQGSDDKGLPALAPAQAKLAEAAAKANQGESTQHPLLVTAQGQLTAIGNELTASHKAEATTAQLAADQTLRHFIVEQSLILNTAIPPAAASSDPVITEAETTDLSVSDTVSFFSDFVSGEAPKDKKSEWEILGTRNRAALNQNFARELPLEYRATLKNYYERVAK
jgi:hypothetical protein